LGRRLWREMRGPFFRVMPPHLVSSAYCVKYPLFELMILQLILASGNAL